MNVGARLRKRASYVDTVFWSRIQVERDIGCDGGLLYLAESGSYTYHRGRNVLGGTRNPDASRQVNDRTYGP